MIQSQMTSDLDYNLFKRKVKESFGLDLEAYKRQQMERRLRAVMERRGASDFRTYFSLIQKDTDLLNEFLDRMTINVSELFRNPEHFEVLEKRVLPDLLAKNKNLKLWSAGCSFGGEAYSLAILLDELAPTGKHSILATDIDEKMLARALEGVYYASEIRNVSKVRLSKYFQQTQDGWKVIDKLRRMIRFCRHDLLKDNFETGFHLIACRNVVIYFTDKAKSELYERFYRSLTPGGYLFVGGTERIHAHAQIGYENPYHFFYRKPEVF